MKSILESEKENLKFIFIVSQAEVMDSLDSCQDVYVSELVEGLRIAVEAAPGKKCERCWNYFDESESAKDHPSICGRCATNLESAKA